MSKKKKSDTLTSRQEKLLEGLSDERWQFPGRLESKSYEKLERLGLAESNLRAYKQNYAKNTITFRDAYRRTPRGASEACSLQLAKVEITISEVPCYCDEGKGGK